MANFIVKKVLVDTKGVRFFTTEKVFGQIRLWIEGDPPTPTDYFILVGDFLIAEGKEIKTEDQTLLNLKINEVLQKAKVSLSDYRIGKNFHMDIKVPKAVIDGYAG